MRRLPGPAVGRLSDEGNFRCPIRIVSGLAENTNLIFCADSSESWTANGCPVLRGAGTKSREAMVRKRKSRSIELRALLSAPSNLVLFS
jgi:hypothetical protein